jgi:RNA polymerase sigma factor (sigma-70 family)
LRRPSASCSIPRREGCFSPAVGQGVNGHAAAWNDHVRKDLVHANQQLRAAVGQALEQESQERVRQQEARRISQLLDGLKPRERQVFHLVAAGMANKQIAARLGVCLQTVKLHRGRLMRKLQLPSVAELARLAEQARSLLARPLNRR